MPIKYENKYSTKSVGVEKSMLFIVCVDDWKHINVWQVKNCALNFSYPSDLWNKGNSITFVRFHILHLACILIDQICAIRENDLCTLKEFHLVQPSSVNGRKCEEFSACKNKWIYMNFLALRWNTIRSKQDILAHF